LVRGNSMQTCAKCQAGLPEGLRFCLQCGASLAAPAFGEPASLSADAAISAASAAPPVMREITSPPKPPVSPFREARTPASTINLKIAPTPVITPKFTPLATNARPSLGDNVQDVDDELLKKSFEKPVRHQPGAVICRFCKGPLFLGGDFCEHCGAPVAEAAPPGVVLPPKPAAQEQPYVDDDPLADMLGPAQVAPPAPVAPASPTGLHSGASQLPPTEPPAQVKPQRPAPIHNPYLTPARTPEEQPAGLMGKLKGIFKKG
jgi:hypothetical protein